MNAGTFFLLPISSSIVSTASFAPPCSGPYSAAAAPASDDVRIGLGRADRPHRASC